MKKKLFLYSFVLFSAFFAVYSTGFASAVIPQKNIEDNIRIDETEENYSEADVIKRINFRNKFQKSDEEQIRIFLKKYNHYSEKGNLKKLKELYADDFANNDGFTKESLFKMFESSKELYKDVKYTTVTDEIKVSGKYASVRAHETAQAYTNNPSVKLKNSGAGIVISNSEYIDSLVKEKNKWKIQASEILSETVSVKYGRAKDIKIDIISPENIPAGSSYEVSLKIELPDDMFALGSIENEKISFPQEGTKNIFRTVRNGELARVLTANSENKNEYASAAVAFAEPKAITEEKAGLNITGAAFIMKRINVVNHKKAKEALNGAE